jgi:hypothetical protein
MRGHAIAAAEYTPYTGNTGPFPVFFRILHLLLWGDVRNTIHRCSYWSSGGCACRQSRFRLGTLMDTKRLCPIVIKSTRCVCGLTRLLLFMRTEPVKGMRCLVRHHVGCWRDDRVTTTPAPMSRIETSPVSFFFPQCESVIHP